MIFPTIFGGYNHIFQIFSFLDYPRLDRPVVVSHALIDTCGEGDVLIRDVLNDCHDLITSWFTTYLRDVQICPVNEKKELLTNGLTVVLHFFLLSSLDFILGEMELPFKLHLYFFQELLVFSFPFLG